MQCECGKESDEIKRICSECWNKFLDKLDELIPDSIGAMSCEQIYPQSIFNAIPPPVVEDIDDTLT